MKAWQMPDIGDPWSLLEIAGLPSPVPGPGMVRVKIEATDLNFADILQCQGRYQVPLDPPFTPGMNTAGTIEAVGEGVDLAIGQRIVGPTVGVHGGYAEEALILTEQAQVLPDDIDTLTASAMHITYSTGWFGLHLRGNLQPGETVLVLAGAGGVGSAAIELAKVHGCWVVAAAGGPEKVAACKELGADGVIDYASEDLYERAMALSDKRGFDVIYDPVGGEYFDVARRLVAWAGRLLVIGFASDTIPSAPMNHALIKNYSLVGVHMGGYRQKDPTPFAQCFDELYELLRTKKIKPWIDGVVGFEDLPAAMTKLQNRGTKGRLMFDPRM
jgi:NADPH2:quinone reductase